MIEFNDHFLFSGNPQWNLFQKLIMMIRKRGRKIYSSIIYEYENHHSTTMKVYYISAKSQNLYVSLPMLDLNKHKQLSSNHSDYSGTLRSNNGTMRSNKANSSIYTSKPGDYETATIKRSHSRRDSSLINNSSIRADLDSDQLFTWSPLLSVCPIHTNIYLLSTINSTLSMLQVP